MAAPSPSAEAVSEAHRGAGGCDGAWARGWEGVCTAALVLTMADARGEQARPKDGMPAAVGQSPAGEVDSRLPIVSAATMLVVVEVLEQVAVLAGNSLLVDMMTDVVVVEAVLALEVDVVVED